MPVVKHFADNLGNVNAKRSLEICRAVIEKSENCLLVKDPDEIQEAVNAGKTAATIITVSITFF